MFSLLFRYPRPVFTKGHFVLLGELPVGFLVALIVLFGVGSGLLLWKRRSTANPALRGRRGWMLWGLRSAFVGSLLLLLWQPAVTVAELSSDQNIIAILVDDSRSMAISDEGGKTRESSAVGDLQGGLLAGLQKRFQTRVYRLSQVQRVDDLSSLTAAAPATHLGEGLRRLADETSDLPVGAVLLMSDGAENTSGAAAASIGAGALEALHRRRLPVHTIGFGVATPRQDVELEDVRLAANAVANARVAVDVSLRQHGYAGKTTVLAVRDGDRTLAARSITFAPDGVLQSETVYFPAGTAGAKKLSFALEAMPGEENSLNNAVARPLLVSDVKRRILYVEGEPRWEFKFIRRAEDDDPTVQVVSMLRTSENKIYRQGISRPEELADGFPVRAEDLFGYAGIIIGSVAADYFTPVQQELLREFVDRRGGGVLFLGGRAALSDGGWGSSRLSELLPTVLPAGRSNFHRNPATVSLTAAGADSPITRLLDDPRKNSERWRKLTYLADYEDAGTPKPGATVLAEMMADRRRLPLLVTESYGHGRTAVLATGGTWRWQMSEALGDPAHDLFWQQLLRWLVADTPGTVSAAISQRVLMDEGHVELSAQVRNATFEPSSNAHVKALVDGPGGMRAMLEMEPSPESAGLYRAEFTAEKPGTYLAEISAEGAGPEAKASGRDVVTFLREDGIAENFHTQQNRALLEQISAETGGRSWKRDAIRDLPRDISYSEAGLSVRGTKELWNMPIVFFLLMAMPMAEWMLRRRWGVI